MPWRTMDVQQQRVEALPAAGFGSPGREQSAAASQSAADGSGMGRTGGEVAAGHPGKNGLGLDTGLGWVGQLGSRLAGNGGSFW